MFDYRWLTLDRKFGACLNVTKPDAIELPFANDLFDLWEYYWGMAYYWVYHMRLKLANWDLARRVLWNN